MGEIVEARHIAMYVAHDCGISCPDIAKAFRRAHATVLHGIRKIRGWRETDALIRQHIERLTARVRLPESAVPVEFTDGPFQGVAVDSRTPVVVALLAPLGEPFGERPYVRLAWCGSILEPAATVTRYSLTQDYRRVTVTFYTHNDITGFDESTIMTTDNCFVERISGGQMVYCYIDSFVYEEMLEKLFNGFDKSITPRCVADKPGVFLKQ